MITVAGLKARKFENGFSYHLKLTQNWSRSPASNLARGMSECQNSKIYIMYRISVNSFRGNFFLFGSWSAATIQGRKLLIS